MISPRLLAAASAALLVAPVLLVAQTPSSPAFEVASVKPTRSAPGAIRIETQPGGRFVATNATLRALIQNAYGLQSFQIVGGPAWLATDRFDIVAKAETADGDTRMMLRTLLAERFKLTVRSETRELPLYTLVVARSDGRLGPSLHLSASDCRSQTAASAQSVVKAPPAPGDQKPCGIQMGLGSLVVGGAALSQVANTLTGLLDRSVVDRTGLRGTFDATLRWTPDESTPGMAQKAKYVPSIDPNGPSIFTAMQEQLGLKLEPAKGPVDVLVIVGAQQPTAN
jgi:uncharacterized protein (TIGR03435 family)